MKKEIEIKRNWFLNWTSYNEDRKDFFSDSVENWISAEVPGDVHLDLYKAGLGPDFYYGMNADLWRWVEDKDFWYKTDFILPEIQQEEKIFIYFEGIDTFATIYLNGKEIGKNFNMFTPIEIDITNIVKRKEKNQLIVKISSPIFSVDIRSDKEVKSDWNIPRLFARKAQFNYGWDIAPRFVSCGIWKPVKIIISKAARIKDCWIKTKKINNNSAYLQFESEIEFFKQKEAKINLDIFEDNKKIIEIKEHITNKILNKEFEIKNPKLWYPNGLGDPYLYYYKLSLSINGEKIDEYEGTFGIKQVELIQEKQSDGGSLFYFKINGERIFIKGFNWTPLDVIPANITKERYKEILTLVKETNANMLRVWGGGIYENEYFYKLCDEYGLMIWQDFMFACGWYPQNEEFLKNTKNEATYIVKRLRKHACISLWSGGNENDIFRYWITGKEYINHKISKVLKSVWEKFNSEIPFIPDSPFSPKGDDPNNSTEGDTHKWAHGKSYKDDFYIKDKPRFISEIGHISVPSKEILLKFIPSDKLWPPFNEYWFYHACDTIRVGWKYRIQSLFDSIQNNNLSKPDNIDKFIEITQQLQTEAYKFWTEFYFNIPECGGILLWNVCDCWGEISDSIIAYPNVPKKVYYKIKECFSNLPIRQ